MKDKSRDRELGMDRPITRRDFLNGVALTIGGAAATCRRLRPSRFRRRDKRQPAGACRASRPQRDGDERDALDPRRRLLGHRSRARSRPARSYDLVVVGGGISGLAAALLYRQQAGEQAKILILENNDDFGGHARRNEFKASNGKTIFGYGGSQSLQTPSYFSPLVNKVLEDVGIDLATFEEWYDAAWHEERGLGEAVFFAKEVFGTDVLVPKTESAAEWVPNTPLNDKAKRNLIELIDAPPDYLPGKTREEKFEILSQTTYADFLTKICGYDPQLVDYFQNTTEAYFGCGIDGVTALDAWGNYDPGFDGMDLGDMPYKTMSPSGRLALTDPDEYIHHFPDGNASVARAFVRKLIPAAQPGTTMEELFLQPVDYSKLDLPDSATRLRLNASVVRVKHDGPPETAASVTLTYLEDGKMKTVKAGHVVLACWHRVIPHITDELGEAQVEALNDQVKIPLIYTNVLIRNWEAFDKLKISGFCGAEMLLGQRRDRLSGVERELQIRRQAVRSGAAPYVEDAAFSADGLSARDQATAGRYSLVDISFEDMEREIRDLLGARAEGRRLRSRRATSRRSPAIAGRTAMRWNTCGHGTPIWPDGPLPIETSRKGWGRIAIANSDAGAYAYVHSAIDQAGRAVKELLGDKADMPAFADFPGPPRDQIGL